MPEDKPKATKKYLAEVQLLIRNLQDMLDADTTARRRSTDQPLEPGETRSRKYKTVVHNSQVTEQEKANYLKQLNKLKAEEERVKKELGLS